MPFVGRRWWLLAFALLIVTLGVIRLNAVAGLLPYGHHVDERHLTKRARAIVQTGDYNPHFFRYPSLPIYLTAASMQVGATLQGVGHTPHSWEMPQTGGAYQPPWIFGAPRLLFSLCSIATLALVGLIARKLYRSDLALLLAPLILSASSVVQRSSVHYLNVDVLAVLFVSAALWVAFQWWERDSYWLQSVLPGVLAGMAVASKYNSGLVLVPLLLRVSFTARHQRLGKLAALGGCAALAFFVCVPHSLLDSERFWADVAWEVNHYREGHLDYDGEAGLPQLMFYLRSLVADFGSATVGLAALGAALFTWITPKRSLTLLSLPVLMLLHMSTNRVHFLRTVLPVFVLLPVLATGGLLALGHMAMPAFWRKRWAIVADRGWLAPHFLQGKRWPRGVLLGATLIYLVWGAPPLVRDLRVTPDTRNVVAAWLRKKARSAHVLIAPEIGFSKEALRPISWHPTRPGMQQLLKQLAQTPVARCLIVVPRYTQGLTVRARGRRDAISKVLHSHKARRVLHVAGEELPLPGNEEQIDIVSNPELSVHLVEPCDGRQRRQPSE